MLDYLFRGTETHVHGIPSMIRVLQHVLSRIEMHRHVTTDVMWGRNLLLHTCSLEAPAGWWHEAESMQ
jgi:hypothetical protein